MFIGRERELAMLNSEYSRNAYGCIVLYGRRRIGKTALINEFIKDKNAVYFMGVESNEKQNLEITEEEVYDDNTIVLTVDL